MRDSDRIIEMDRKARRSESACGRKRILPWCTTMAKESRADNAEAVKWYAKAAAKGNAMAAGLSRRLLPQGPRSAAK